MAAEVANEGQHIIIERHGKPLAALVSVDDLERLEAERTTSPRPQGALALVGAWRDVDDEVIDTLIEDIYARRRQDSGREVNLEA